MTSVTTLELRDVIRRLHGVEATHIEQRTSQRDVSWRNRMGWDGRSLQATWASEGKQRLCVGA